MGVAYDLFGTGKTAVKVGLNRYVTDESLGSGTNTIIGSPQIYFQYTAARAWTDANRNFYPDCNWTNGAAQDLRGERRRLLRRLHGRERQLRPAHDRHGRRR